MGDILERLKAKYGAAKAYAPAYQRPGRDMFEEGYHGLLDLSTQSRRWLRPDERDTNEPIGFVENIERGMPGLWRKTPVLGTMVGAAEDEDKLARLNRLQRFANEGFKTTADILQQEEDARVLEDYLAPLLEEQRRGKTFMAKAGSVVAGLPKTFGEFGLAASAGPLGYFGLSQTMAMENITARTLANKLEGKQESGLKTLVKAETEAGIELLTEAFVGRVARWGLKKPRGLVGKLVKKTKAGRSISELMDRPIGKVLAEVGEKAKFHGVPEELLEENVAAVLRAGLRLDDQEGDLLTRIKNAIPDLEDQAAMTLAFALFPGAKIVAGATDVAASALEKRRAKEALLSGEDIPIVMAIAPDAAERIINEEPSRKVFDEVFPGVRFSQREREMVQGYMRNMAETTALIPRQQAQAPEALQPPQQQPAEAPVQEDPEQALPEPAPMLGIDLPQGLPPLQQQLPAEAPVVDATALQPIPDGASQTEAETAVEANAEQIAAEDPNAEDPILFAGVPTGPLKKGFQKWFTSRGLLPDPTFQRLIERDGKINAQAKQVQQTLRRYDRTMKALYGKAVPAEVIQAADAAIKGDANALQSLPEELQDSIVEMRDHVDRLSDRLLNLGMIEGDLLATIADNKGMYLHRSYRAFDNPADWAKKVPVEVVARARQYLRGAHPDWSQDQVEHRLNRYIEAGSQGNIFNFVKGKDLSTLKERNDIPKALRDLMGEYIEPDVNYAKSVAKMVNLIENHEFLTDVREAGMGTFFFEATDPNIDPDASTQIAAEGTDAMAPLDGMYTYPEVAEAFNEIYEAQRTNNPTLRLLLYLNSVSKLSKTVGSTQTHVRNLLGNTAFALLNGHYRFGVGATAAKAVLADLGVRMEDSRQWEDYMRNVIELGVVHESARAGELRDMMSDMADRGMASFAQEYDAKTKKRGILRKAMGATAALYQAEDNVWKIYAFENEKASYRKAFPEWTERMVEERAAEIVRNTYPTYSLVPRAVKALRKVPFMAPFISFSAEVLRCTWNTAKYAAQEIQDPRTRAIGARRASGMAVAATTVPALALLSRMMFGVSDDEDKNLRRFMADWSKNGSIFHLGKDKDGNYNWLDLSYVDAHDYIRKPLALLMQGQFGAAGKEAAEPIIGEELFLGKLLDVARNRKESGGPVWNAQDSDARKAQSIIAHIGDAMTPGTVSSLQRIVSGAMGKVSRYGKVYSAPIEATAMLTGQRIQKTDPDTAMTFQVREFRNAFNDAARLLTEVASSKGNVTDAALTDAYDRSENARVQAYTKLAEDIQAAKDLGVDRKRIIQILKSQGIPTADIRMLIMGKYMPRIPSEQWLKTVERQLGTLPGEGASVQDIRRRRQLIRSSAIERRRQALGQ